MELDTARSLQIWTYSGVFTLDCFDDLEAQLGPSQEEAAGCFRLLISYKRGIDVSGMDAAALERVLLRVKDIHARLLNTGIRWTAHAVADDIVRHAVEHYVLRVRDRADDTHGVFVTRAEAEAWLLKGK